MGKALREKKALRAVIFLIIAALLFVYLNQIFNIAASDGSKKIFKGFYDEPKNTVDAVYLGTSATNRYFISPKAYHDAGMTVYNLATMGLPMMFVPHLIDEVEKTQDPKLYIIELRGVLKSKNDVTDAHIRRVTDSMKWSSNRFAAIDNALDYVEGATGELSNIDEGWLDYYVPIVKYHSRLVQGDMTVGDFVPVSLQNIVKGYVLSPNTLIVRPQDKPVYSDGRAELAPEMEDALLKVLDKCDELDKDVLFVLSPYATKEGQAEKFNTAIDMVTERGYPVLDCNQEEVTDAMGINWERDFYNSKHVNYKGAEKYTDYMVDYLVEQYNLPYKYGAIKYESWEDAYQEYLDFVEEGLHKPEGK